VVVEVMVELELLELLIQVQAVVLVKLAAQVALV
jgi:hypothetical protein